LAASLAATALAGVAAGSGATLTFIKIITMTKLKAGAIAAIALAGVATPLVIHYKAQAKLRDGEAALRQQNDQLAQLAADNERLSNLVAHANNSTAQDQSRELLKLRGEVGVLKRQLAAAVSAQQRAKGAQSNAAVDPAEQQKQIGISKLNYSRDWMLAFMQYASQNKGEFPTNFEQALSFLPEGAKAETNLVPDQFEIVYQGAMSEIASPATIIVIREKEALQTANGGSVRAYGFADGHSEIHKAVDGNFQPWEAQHMISPQTPGQPGQ
jgi:hypothetical protein